MSLPPPPLQPAEPPRPGSPVTREIPVAAPAGSGTTQVLPTAGAGAGPTPISPPLPPPPATAAPEPTGPVDFLPGLRAPSAEPKPARTPRARDRASLAGTGLVIAAIVLLEIGLLLDFGGASSFWTTVPLWSGFATLAALLGLLAYAGRHPRRAQSRSDRAWKLSAAGLTCLAVFWVLVVLPVGNTDRGFVLTAALGCLGAALWIAPGRKAWMAPGRKD